MCIVIPIKKRVVYCVEVCKNWCVSLVVECVGGMYMLAILSVCLCKMTGIV